MTKSNGPLRRAPIVAATFGPSFGYRFDGDSVALHASFQLCHYLAHEIRWYLQLQAGPFGTSSTEAPLTHIVAEAPLPPLAELTGAVDAFSVTTPAQPPAGQGEFQLALALISRQTEQSPELHDIAIFSKTERFTQPRLVGSLACTFGKSDLVFTAGRIENPRDTANTSGTLSLEFWALSEPYEGGAFQGQPLAGIILGQLAGQDGWDIITHTLHCAKPASGKWHVVAMLREWTGNGYTTRDYRNLAEPLVIDEATPTPAKSEKPVTPRPVAASSPPIKAVEKSAKSIPVKTTFHATKKSKSKK